ncbi:hypothetical protein SAT01_16890 [Sinomonas atrocyanea]|nr:hypothetical protein SAT01_16890 [Sinomonas atrocyanea]GGG57551.1 hypothetical protein GCM10007172_05500 [Sinomonas atrocyanea]
MQPSCANWRPTWQTWRRTADPAARVAVAEVLDRVQAALTAHLGHEEDQILPVAAAAMSKREWDEFGKHGRPDRNMGLPLRIPRLGQDRQARTPDGHPAASLDRPARAAGLRRRTSLEPPAGEQGPARGTRWNEPGVPRRRGTGPQPRPIADLDNERGAGPPGDTARTHLGNVSF